MTQTRHHRTKCFRKQVKKEWEKHFWKFIEDNIEKPWSWKWLSSNPNLPLDYVLAHPEKPWEWGCLSRNPSMSMDDVINHPELPWTWDGL